MKSGLFAKQGYPQWPKMSDREICFFLQCGFQSRSTPLFMIGWWTFSWTKGWKKQLSYYKHFKDYLCLVVSQQHFQNYPQPLKLERNILKKLGTSQDHDLKHKHSGKCSAFDFWSWEQKHTQNIYIFCNKKFKQNKKNI